MSYISIPYDIYESSHEILVVMPLGGVKKDTVSLDIKNYKLVVTGRRYKPQLKDDFVLLGEECYRWEIKTEVDLPPTVYFKDIHSTLTLENVLYVTIPKNIEPDQIKVEIESE